jgi:tetratricopeptide (TPR) repeat protein
LSDTEGKEYSASNLENEFNLLSNPNFKHYYELANFYKDNEYYKESIKYYSLALKNIRQDHSLIPKILDRRGTSYERLGDWEKAEKDLTESLRILPDQAHVLNYLAYSWIEKKINTGKALEMLKRATKLRKNDGYIIDSLGWAYYANKNYVDAEKFLQRAVELMPLDPIINDHYADALWMLSKSIQARYFWKYVLSLDNAEERLKDNVGKKLIFGINKKL